MYSTGMVFMVVIMARTDKVKQYFSNGLPTTVLLVLGLAFLLGVVLLVVVLY